LPSSSVSVPSVSVTSSPWPSSPSPTDSYQQRSAQGGFGDTHPAVLCLLSSGKLGKRTLRNACNACSEI
jgi:hypothetical protein